MLFDYINKAQPSLRWGVSLIATSSLLLAACSQKAETPEKIEQTETQPPCEALDTGQTKLVKGGEFILGVDAKYPEEGPDRKVQVADFKIDTHEVTNAQFAEFVVVTGYVTEAEKAPPNAEQLPPEMRDPGSAVFVEPEQQGESWWRWITGANWKQPLGPDSDIEGKENHPVVHISLADAQAYAKWKGGSLPSEEQWEYAARAGSDTSNPPMDKSGKISANHYQGVFPAKDLGEDGFVGSAPAGCFPANDFGLYDMIGNVWEWTQNTEETEGKTATIKGGSYLCAQNYCKRYRPSARQFQEKDLGTNHIGFRLVYPADTSES